MSHDPAPHGPRESPTAVEEKMASSLALAQFLVTGTVLCVVAALAYIAGTHAAKGGGHGGEASGAKPKVDVAALLSPTPELISSGKQLFAVNCASCHGTSGLGDGVAAAALNPKPRNFTEGTWRYGGGEARVVRTITEGSPGTAMAAFSSLPLQDRFALAHFVRSLGPKLVEDTPEDLAWLGPIGGGGGADSGAAAAGAGAGAVAVTPSIPIERAMQVLAEPAPPVGAALASIEPDAGSSIYAARCASCHGTSGEGGVHVRMLGSNPYAQVVTWSFGSAKAAWAQDAGGFERLVLQGSTGYVMPANGDLSRAELRDLYLHVLKLRARQETAGRAGS